MRPVDKGDSPGTFTDYSQALPHLEDRLDIYCSYCERRMPTSLAVEHIAPKSHHPNLLLEWDNFLLACTNCNSVKSDKDIPRQQILWTDEDNTFLAINYSKGGFVRIDKGLNTNLQSRASELIKLVGLNRHKARNWPKPSKRDNRWKQRDEVWEIAEEAKKDFIDAGQTDIGAKCVIRAALGYGFFSVWMTIFEQYEEIRKRLISSFKGTAKDCFDSNGAVIKRPGGVI